MSQGLGQVEIFDKLSMYVKLKWRHALKTTDKGVLSIPAEYTGEATNQLFASLQSGGFATFVVSGKPKWNPTS